jgi:hypothetical protein
MKYPPQLGSRIYFFAGEHRDPNTPKWIWDRSLGHTYDIYDNGTLATVYYDDVRVGGDRDFNDLIVEVAVVRRQLFFDNLEVAQRDDDALKRFATEIEPKLEPHDRARSGE